MYKPKKYIRLDQLFKTPRLPDVRNLLNEGKKNRSCTVELPWKSENLGMRFSLTVRVEVGGGEPIWTLYEGEGANSRVMWSTGFNEVELLYDVLTLSLPSDGPNIFEPYREDIQARPPVEIEPQPERAYDRREPAAGSAQDFYSSPPESVDAARNAEYANHLMSEPPYVPPAPRESIKSRPVAAPTADLPAPDFSRQPINQPTMQPSVQQGVAYPGPLPDGQMPQTQAGYPPYGYGQPQPQPQYAQYPPNYPYGQPNYNVPPGYAPPPGFPQGYPYNQYPYPHPAQGYPQAGSEPLSAASTIPLSGAAQHTGQSGQPGQFNDPYAPQYGASHVVAPHPDLVKRRPNVMLGSFLVDAGLVPKATIDAALQVQILVSQGTLSAIKAAEAVRRAHIRGGSVETENDERTQPGDAVVRVKPQIGQVLVMAGIISAAQLKTALGLQDVLRAGSMTMEEAVRTLAQTMHVKDVIAPGASDQESEEIKLALGLLKKSGLLQDQDLDAAIKTRDSKGGQVSKILVAAGKIDKLTLESAVLCQKQLTLGALKMEQIVPALHYCQRMRVSITDAASDLGLTLR